MEFIPLPIYVETEPRPTTPSFRPLARSILVLSVAIVLAGLGIWRFSRRASKKVFFHASCQSLMAPTGLLLSPSIEQTLIHVRGFTGSVNHVDSILSKHGERLTGDRVSFVQVKDPRVQSLPTLTVKAVPPLGPIMLQTTGKTQISIYDQANKETLLGISYLDGSENALDIQATSFKVQGVRVRSPELNDAEDASIVLTNTRGALVHLTLKSLPPLGAEVPISEFHYLPTKANFQILLSSTATQITGAVELDRCVDSDVDVFGGDEILRAQGSAYRLQASNLTIEELRAERLTTGNETRPVIVTTITGTVSSIAQNGRELLPTELTDLLKRPAYEVGLWGALALLIVSSGGVFLKRALDIISAALMPDRRM